MCVYSWVMDHYHDKWLDKWKTIEDNKVTDPTFQPTILPFPILSPEEIAELRELLRKAKEYDKKNNEPECELEEKKQKLKELAEKLGVAIEFP